MTHAPSKNTSRTPFLVLVAVLFLAPAVEAVDTGKPLPPGKPTLDCSDASNDICFECCPGFECADPGSKIACCQRDCDIVNQPPPPGKPPSPQIQVVLSAGGAQLTFERTQQVEGNSGRT